MKHNIVDVILNLRNTRIRKKVYIMFNGNNSVESFRCRIKNSQNVIVL